MIAWAVWLLAAPWDPPPVAAGSGEEPSVHDLMAAARREAEVRPERLRSWMSRARWAALAPKVTFGVDRSFGRDESLDLADGERDLSTDDDLGWRVSASWDLGSLVFSPDELRVAREGIRLSELRQKVLFEVVRLYFERRRLVLRNKLALREERGPADAPTDAIDHEVRILEIEASLDALTGGAWSRRVRDR